MLHDLIVAYGPPVTSRLDGLFFLALAFQLRHGAALAHLVVIVLSGMPVVNEFGVLRKRDFVVISGPPLA